MRSCLAIVVEGLATGLVGAYGASTAETPAIDGMVAEGFVLDQCFVDSQDLPEQLLSLWTGTHALQRSRPGASLTTQPTSLFPNLQLLTDCERVAELAAQIGCRAVTLVQPHLRQQPLKTRRNVR